MSCWPVALLSQLYWRGLVWLLPGCQPGGESPPIRGSLGLLSCKCDPGMIALFENHEVECEQHLVQHHHPPLAGHSTPGILCLGTSVALSLTLGVPGRGFGRAPRPTPHGRSKYKVLEVYETPDPQVRATAAVRRLFVEFGCFNQSRSFSRFRNTRMHFSGSIAFFV